MISFKAYLKVKKTMSFRLLLKKAGFLFLMLVGLAGLLEIGLRIWGGLKTYPERNFDRYESMYNQQPPLYYFEDRKDTIFYEQAEFSYYCLVDSVGLRNDPNRRIKPNNQRVFLFLGDSFTEGVGGYCGKDMPSQFEDITSKDTIAINAGIVGSDPFFQTRWYRDTFKSFPHHEVVFVLNDSDLVEFVTRGGNERFRGKSVQYKKGPWFEVVYQYSHTVRAIVHGLLGQNHIFLTRKAMEANRSDALRAYAECINAFYKEFGDLVKIHVVLQPYPFECPHCQGIPEIIPLLDEEIHVVNLFVDFGKELQNNQGRLSWSVDGHFNDAGYRRFAEYIHRSMMGT